MPGFDPYVPDTLATTMYKSLQSSGKAETMWTMWFVYYMHINQLYSVYSNLDVFTGKEQSSLTINRYEVGLHVSRKRSVNINCLLRAWKQEYVVFPETTVRLNWDGSYVPSNRRF